MSKIIFAGKDKLSGTYFDKYSRLVSDNLLLTLHTPIPRSTAAELHQPYYKIPEIENVNEISFSAATNSRVQEVMLYASTNDLPIVVMWSGGIDSTVILSAVIKHFPKALLNRVVVKMTNASYYENLYFFENVIKKYGIKYTTESKYDYLNAIVLHGDPGDSLWIGGDILELSAENPSIQHHKINQDNWMLNYLTRKSNKQYALWLIDYVLTDAKIAGITVETVGDFLWYLIFVFGFQSMALGHINEVNGPLTDVNLELFNKNFFLWYTSDDYQIWSMQSQKNKTKFDGTIRGYKMVAKEYIHDLDKNDWYKNYKTKVNSKYIPEDYRFVSFVYSDGRIEI